jgi:hypothetical protein
MFQKTLAEVIELTIMIEEEMSVRKKYISRYQQDFDSEESEDFEEEKKQRPKKKTKHQFEIIKRDVYY